MCHLLHHFGQDLRCIASSSTPHYRQRDGHIEATEHGANDAGQLLQGIAEQKRERAPQLDVMSCCGSYGSIVQVEYALFS
jgi:hypothetical protein